MDWSILRPAVANFYSDADVFRVGFCVFDKYVEITIFIKDSGIQQFILWASAATIPVLFDQLCIWKSGLRIFVEILHVGMRRSRIEIEVILLHVLAVICFARDKTIQTFLQYRIVTIPKCQCKNQNLVAIADSGQ